MAAEKARCIMPDFFLEPDEIHPGRPERPRPVRMVSTGLAPTSRRPRVNACIADEDCVTLCKWAQAQKFGAYVLHLVLEGYVSVAVEGDAIRLGRLAPFLPEMR